MFSRKLLSLLISLLLTLSPFASFDVAAAVEAEGHCMMADMDINSPATNFSADHGAMSHCAHCKDDSCSDSNCTTQSCSTGSLSLIDVKELVVQDYQMLSQFINPETDLFSRSSPPLLRPPV